MALYRYDKPGARVAIYADSVELTTGILWAKRTHVVLLRAVTGVSVFGLGGKTLRVQTAARAYDLEVGVGAASKIREHIMEAIADA